MNAMSTWVQERVKARDAVITMGVFGGLATLFFVLLPLIPTTHTRTGNWESPVPVLMLGLIIGMTYGLLAAGLVLIYRSNRIINFAHGQIGAFAAAIFGLAVVQWHVPYWLAFFPALVVAGGVGAIAEIAVVRRLRNAPAIMSVVATLGVGQFLSLLAVAINATGGFGSLFPQPAGMPTFRVGALLVTPAYAGMLILSPFAVLAIGLFLKFSRFGLAMRAASGNPEAARMTGIFASRMSSLAWGLAGALAAFSAILTSPTQNNAGDSFGPSLLLVALTGAVIARMQSLPVAVIAGIGIGVVEQLILWNFAQAGLAQMALFVIILVALLVQRQRGGRSEDKGAWAAVQAARPLPPAIRRVPSVRAMVPLTVAISLAFFALLPLLVNNAAAAKLTAGFAFVVIAISVGIITGLGGQLSLGQFAIGAIGAYVSFEVSRRTGNYFLSFLYAGLGAAAVSALIGLPALRIKGLLLTVTTLSFALVVPSFLLQQSWMLGSGQDPGRPVVGNFVFETGRSYYYVGLATVVVAMLIARNVRGGGIGRRLVAVRDNEDAARAFTVKASLVKLQGFALAGFIAGIGGAMYGHSLALIGQSAFPTNANITVVVIAVIGGIGILSGPILGGIVVVGATFLPLDSAGLAATALGQLLIIMYLPGGLGSLVTPLRDRLASRLAARAGVDVEAAFVGQLGFSENEDAGGEAPPRRLPVRRVTGSTRPLLEVRGLEKSFSGIRAVRGIDFEVARGETLGLIGPNGAGKTTTFELVAGFTRSDGGTVTYDGRDITALSPEARGQRGLIRSFQDAALFPTLTVMECVQLSLERVSPTKLLPSLLGMKAQDRRKEQEAEDFIKWMGLERYRASQIRELSTGTRRIAEIACLVALEPTLLLLDEPSSGVAQKETEALGALLAKLKVERDLTLIIIEHDIPLIMNLADRIVCMEDGVVIAEGPPDVVRNDPAVVTAYLGGDRTAIERSSSGDDHVDTDDTPTSPNAVSAASPDRELVGAGATVGASNAPTLIEMVPGLGPARSDALMGAFGTLDGVLGAQVQELATVRGIGPQLAARIHAAAPGRRA